MGCANGKNPPAITGTVAIMGPDGTAAEYTYEVGVAYACLGAQGELGEHCKGKPPIVYPTMNVRLKGFLIDEHEVTNLQYLHCVEKGGCSEPEFVDAGEFDKYYEDKDGEFDEYPVVNISFEQAKDYCAFAGKRLPTEWEWERVARGLPDSKGNRRDFAVGDNPKACIGKSVAIEVCAPDGGSPQNVRAAIDDIRKEGASGLVYGMSGNASEWVDDIYVADITCKCGMETNFQTCSDFDDASQTCNKSVACQAAFTACSGLDGATWASCAGAIQGCDGCKVDGCDCDEGQDMCTKCVKPECFGQCLDSKAEKIWVCEPYGADAAVHAACIGGTANCTGNQNAGTEGCTPALVQGGDRVYRGASYSTKDICKTLTTHRLGNKLDKNDTRDYVGFRCAADL